MVLGKRVDGVLDAINGSGYGLCLIRCKAGIAVRNGKLEFGRCVQITIHTKLPHGATPTADRLRGVEMATYGKA